jgi:site-specific DNA recombinase
MTQRITALIYVRKSVVKTARDEISPERQRAACIAFCESRGWRYEIYEDAEGHRSGRNEDHRPEWRRLKAQLSRPDVVAVVVNSLDRASRSPKDFFNFLDLLHRYGVELVSLTEQFDTTTAIGRAFLAILMVIASLESDMASERVSATIQYRKAQGIHWGRTPYGYDRTSDGILVPNADADTVRRAFELYISGHSLYRVARILNAEGRSWRDKDGRRTPFTRWAVRSIISNAAIYRGLVPEGRQKDLSGDDNVDAIMGRHEAIISEEMAVMAQAERRKRDHPVRQTARVYPLSGVLHCAVCGARLRGVMSRGVAYYRHEGKSCNPGMGRFPAREMEKTVLDLLNIRIPPEIVDGVREVLEERAASMPEREEALRQARRLEGKLSRLKMMYAEGYLADDEFRSEYCSTQRELESIRKQLGPLSFDLDGILERLSRLGEVLASGSADQQKHAVEILIERIEIGQDGEIISILPRAWCKPLFLTIAACNMRRSVPPREFESLSQP